MGDWSKKWDEVKGTYDIISDSVDRNPEIAAYCAKRGFAAGAAGALDAIPDAAMLLTGHEPVGLASEATKHGINKINGIDESKWTPDQKMACLGAGILPELGVSILLPMGMLKGASILQKVSTLDKMAKAVAASRVTKTVLMADTAASVVVGGYGVNEARKAFSSPEPAGP